MAVRQPAGAAPLRGERPFLFLRKKKRSFTLKKKRGPVYGRFRVKNGGLRLSYGIGDPSRPLRPSHSGTGKECGPIWQPPGYATLGTECGSGPSARLGEHWMVEFPLYGAQRPRTKRAGKPALREAPVGGGWLGPTACPCSPTAGRNGRGWSPNSA